MSTRRKPLAPGPIYTAAEDIDLKRFDLSQQIHMRGNRLTRFLTCPP